MATAAEHDSEWLQHVKEYLESDEAEACETNSDACIFGIAPPLWRLETQAYVPQVSSIGPYHHKSVKQYEETDTYKLKIARALERMLPGFKFSRLVEKIQSFDYRIRTCYSKRIPYSRESLSTILALDASFLFQFLKSICRRYELSVDNQLDPIRNTPLWYAIKNDILKLENQVPMFVLVEAFLFTTNIDSGTQVVNSSQREISQDGRRCQELNHLAVILQDACMHFNPLISDENFLPQPLDLNSTKHLLGYLYHYVTAASHEHTQSESQSNPLGEGCILNVSKMVSTTIPGYLPSATELSVAGIEFAAYDSGDLRKICFNTTTSTFLLPKITMNDCTEVVLRNLVAFELNLKTEQKPLTRYTYLMEQLIRREGDVALLKRYGVLNHQMGSDAEVVRMWSSMSKSTWENKFEDVDKAIEEANKHYRNNWRVVLAEFWKKHSSKLYAGMMLLLQAVQVSCLFHGNK